MCVCAAMRLFIGRAWSLPARRSPIVDLPGSTAVDASLRTAGHHRSPGQGARGDGRGRVHVKFPRLLRRMRRQRLLLVPRKYDTTNKICISSYIFIFRWYDKTVSTSYNGIVILCCSEQWRRQDVKAARSFPGQTSSSAIAERPRCRVG